MAFGTNKISTISPSSQYAEYKKLGLKRATKMILRDNKYVLFIKNLIFIFNSSDRSSYVFIPFTLDIVIFKKY